MKRLLITVLLVTCLILPLSGCFTEASTAVDTYTQNIFPSDNATYNIGSGNFTFNAGYFNEIWVSGNSSIHCYDGSTIGGGQGSVWWVDDGVPDDEVGTDTDLYLDSLTADVYRKNGGSWGSPAANIRGIQGLAGAVGEKGDKGDKGDQGIQGLPGNDGAPGAPGEDGDDGISIVWLGSFASAPESPNLNEAYRDTTDGMVYIWDGDSWAEMVEDGAGASALDDLTDVTITDVTEDDVLTWDGEAWVNAPAAGGLPSPLPNDWEIGSQAIIMNGSLADGEYSGVAINGTAGTTLAFGDLVYLAVADSRWELTDADTEAKTNGKLGICILAAANDGDATIILLWGNVRSDTAFPSMTVASPVYVSQTDGDITSTAPSASGKYVRIVGYANTADELFFCPDRSWIKLK
jgi:hypothetical protein